MLNNTNEYDVMIIGAGPGGMTAAIYAKRANLNVCMLEKGAPGGNMMTTWEVENYTGLGKISGFELSEKMFNHTQELGVEYKYGDVTNIVDQGTFKEIHTTTGEVYKTKVIIVATGTVPRSTKAEGESRLTGRGVSWCAICDGAFFKEKEIIVVGGGNSAIEEAIYLTKIVKHITVVNILETLQADKKSQEEAKETGKMDFLLGYEVVSFDGENQLEAVTLRNVKTKEIKVLPTEGAFVFIGQVPTSGFVKDLGITNQWGYIQTDEHMQTKIPGIFAVGDVIEKELRQIITAAADGAIAAVQASKYIETL